MADDAAAPEGEPGEEAVAADAESDAVEATDADAEDGPADDTAPAKVATSHVRLAMILGLVGVVALAGLCGWLGFRAYSPIRRPTSETCSSRSVGRRR